MKKINKLHYILLITLTVLFAVSVFGFTRITASADMFDGYDVDDIYNSVYNYSYYFEDYDVTYDVAQNRKIAVSEIITIHYTGKDCTGFIKDIPINGGEQVKNVKVYELSNGVEKDVYYDVYFEDEFLSVDIGDYSKKTGKTFTYLLTYDYCLTKAQEGKDKLDLNVIGLGRNFEIENANVTLILPNGFKNAEYIIGDNNSEQRYNDCPQRKDGDKTILELKDVYLAEYQGITFEMNFESGALSVYSDASPYLFLIPAFILLAVLIILKLFVFNRNYLTPVVNYDAPNKMDPLITGKLIDNRVNDEDVTSLIFYWASKGYIKINFDNKNDPTIIRIMTTLPDSSPAYEKLMYNNLFKKGETVKPSQLTNSFYSTVDKVRAMVNKRTGGLYEKSSLTVSVAFAVLSGILLGIAPFILAICNISAKLFYLHAFIVLVPIILINLSAQALAFYRLKLNKKQFWGCVAGLAVLCAVTAVFYWILVPACIMSTSATIILSLVCGPVYAGSVILVTRTKSYTEKLNDIIGFKNYITLAEKDQLELMLEDDPQFYYHILPYAQVLGVTDIWEEKFKDIAVPPPQWATGNAFTAYLEFRIINNILRNSMTNISSGMISRPSSSGRSGGHGGFGGGHIGGGHGGGGFRGR